MLKPEMPLPLPHHGPKETVRLIDDAFVRICDLMNDVSVTVRVNAGGCMASYQDVSPDTLAQTFSKQIMSRLRKRRVQKKRHGVSGSERTCRIWMITILLACACSRRRCGCRLR